MMEFNVKECLRGMPTKTTLAGVLIGQPAVVARATDECLAPGRSTRTIASRQRRKRPDCLYLEDFGPRLPPSRGIVLTAASELQMTTRRCPHMWVANVIGAAISLVTGLIIRLAKASSLIAGYNTMPREKKAEYDEEALTRFVGNLLMLSGAVLVVPLPLLLIVDKQERLINTTWIVYVAVIIGGVIYANTGNRFKKRR
jgi:hypothetical protein